MAYSGDSDYNEDSISEIDSSTDNNSVSYTASSRYTPPAVPQPTVLEDSDSEDSDGSDDVCDERILRAYLKMLHDHLVKTVIVAQSCCQWSCKHFPRIVEHRVVVKDLSQCCNWCIFMPSANVSCPLQMFHALCKCLYMYGVISSDTFTVLLFTVVLTVKEQCEFQ